MSFWKSLLGIPQGETRDSTLANPSAELLEAFGYWPTASGISLTEEKALRLAAVNASVRVIAESAASLPLHLYARRDRSRERVTQDPRARMLALTPNEDQTAMKLWETVFAHLALWGNAYLYKDVNPASGVTQALYVLRPDRTTPVRLKNGNKAYEWYDNEGKKTIFLRDEVIHIPAFGTGELGLSPIGLARDTLGTAWAAEEFAGRFFQNNARPGGVVEIPGNMTEEQAKEFIRKFEASHRGLSKAQQVALLTNGARWVDVGIPPKEAQFIEQRKYSTRQIASIFRVPPFMIGDMEPGSVSYASVQEQSQHFVKNCLTGYLRRVEQALDAGLFGSELDRAEGLYVKFDVDGLLRGDPLSRAGFYHLALQDGWMSRNEVRELEDMSAQDGLDEFLSPLNMGNQDTSTLEDVQDESD